MAVLLQAEVTVSELIRIVSKAMLLQLPQLVTQPGFPALWLAVLSSLSAAAASGHEGLSDAAAAALQNLLIMLHDMVSAGRQARCKTPCITRYPCIVCCCGKPCNQLSPHKDLELCCVSCDQKYVSVFDAVGGPAARVERLTAQLVAAYLACSTQDII